MNQIKMNKDNSITIEFNGDFYTLNCILSTSKAFEDICDVYLDEDQEKLISVNISSQEETFNIEEIAYEFCNYALSELITQYSKKS